MREIKPFIFKQFSIEHDKCLMKVGTDGVLLGGWIPRTLKINSILDIGTGSGVIALMLAQKYPQSKIIGIDQDRDSAQQAGQNFANSPWHQNMTAMESTLEKYCKLNNEKYDLIVSNPPFHEETILSSRQEKIASRSTLSLPFEELLDRSSKMLSPKGYLALIAPHRNLDKLITLAQEAGVYLVKKTAVRGMKNTPIKRVLFLFSKFETTEPLIDDEIFLENTRHQLSDDYSTMTRDYYIHL